MPEPNQKLGPYTLVNRIGVGGFGVVWLAEKRTAIATTRFALKLPRGEDIDVEAFKDEAAIWLEASGHPNVLPLIDADIYEDQVVIVSEYVTDGSLAAWLKQHGGKSPTAEAAVEMIDGVLAGLNHLHSRRIIHRDLKPENILLQRETPRLADFGIARLLKTTSQSAQVSGTLAYMAPEAFDGKRNEQTDVWSVGVIFYQILSGRLPYDQPDMVSFIGAIMRHDPPPLPESVPEVLRNIVEKALQRDPLNRYLSAAEMRRDLREAEHHLWLGGRKTVVDAPAAPPRSTVVSQASAPQTLPPGPIAPTQPMRLAPKKTEAISAPSDPSMPSETLPSSVPVKRKLRTNPWLIGIVFTLIGTIIIGGVYLARKRNQPKNQSSPVTTASAPAPGPYTLKQTLTGFTSAVNSLAFSPDGRIVASTATFDDVVRLWDAQTGVLKQTLTGHAGAAWSVAFSPDGKSLVAGAEDGTLKLWDLQTGTLMRTLAGNVGRATAVAFSPDGKAIASGGSEETAKLWDAQTGALKQTFTGSSSWITSLAFHPDGKTLAGASKQIILWDVESARLKLTLSGHTWDVNSVAFSPDGQTIASGSEDHKVILWDAQTGALKHRMSDHGYWVNAVAFAGNLGMLGSAGQDWKVMIWDARTGELKQTLTGHQGPVNTVVFSPDGKTMASGGQDKTVKLWRLQ